MEKVQVHEDLRHHEVVRNEMQMVLRTYPDAISQLELKLERMRAALKEAPASLARAEQGIEKCLRLINQDSSGFLVKKKVSEMTPQEKLAHIKEQMEEALRVLSST